MFLFVVNVCQPFDSHCFALDGIVWHVLDVIKMGIVCKHVGAVLLFIALQFVTCIITWRKIGEKYSSG